MSLKETTSPCAISLPGTTIFIHSFSKSLYKELFKNILKLAKFSDILRFDNALNNLSKEAHRRKTAGDQKSSQSEIHCKWILPYIVQFDIYSHYGCK